MAIKTSQINQCRSCGGSSLDNFLTLEDMPFTDEFLFKKDLGREFISNIDIFFCNTCFTVQTQHDVSVDRYYEDYQYSVGKSYAANNFMKTLAVQASEVYLHNSQNKKILEIGSGDGAQLLEFKKLGYEVLGYEPSSELCKIAANKGIPSIQGLFNENSKSFLPTSFHKIDAIVLLYTFDHLPEPTVFLKTASDLLTDDGVIIIEVHNLELILERNEFCLFEHEHSIYLTEQTASDICDRYGFKVIDYDLVRMEDRRANSLIFVASKKTSRKFSEVSTEAVTPKKFKEKDFLYQSSERIFSSIKKLDRFIELEVMNGKKIAGYGSGGRGVMTLAASNNSSMI